MEFLKYIYKIPIYFYKTYVYIYEKKFKAKKRWKR